MDANKTTADIKAKVDKKAVNIKTKVDNAKDKIKRIKGKGRRIMSTLKE